MIILPYLLGTVTTGMYHHTQLMPVISTVEAEAGGLQISGQSELCSENLSQTIKKRWLGEVRVTKESNCAHFQFP
jgi:hypothetical protein